MGISNFLESILYEQAKWNKWIGFMIEYKGYVGWFEFNEKIKLFEGRVSNVRGLPITFQGKTSEDVRLAFKDAINEYLAWCKEQGKEPDKPFFEPDHFKNCFPHDH